MVTRHVLSLGVLALLLRLTASADPCAGPTAPATLRALNIYEVKGNDPAAVKALAAAYDKWIKSCGGLVVREGHAPAISRDPSLFGFKQTPEGSFMGDYAGWSDWRSLDDLRACVQKGLKEGSVAALRAQAVRAARIVFPLNTTEGVVAVARGRADCSARSFAPATLRMMIAYVLKDPASVPTAIELQNKVTEAATVKPIRYGTGGRAALGKDEYVWGKGISKTADWGVWYDFANEDHLRGYFSPSDKAYAVRSQLRALGTGAMRIVIPLQA